MGSDLPPPPPSPTQQTPRRQVLGGRGTFTCSSSTWLGTAIVPQVACLTAFVVGSGGGAGPKTPPRIDLSFWPAPFFQNSILVGRRERGGDHNWEDSADCFPGDCSQRFQSSRPRWCCGVLGPPQFETFRTDSLSRDSSRVFFCVPPKIDARIKNSAKDSEQKKELGGGFLKCQNFKLSKVLLKKLFRKF